MRARVLALPLLALTLLPACSGGSSDSDGSSQSAASSEASGSAANGNAANRDKPQIDTPDEVPTELKITDITEGTGGTAIEGSIVTIHYVGSLASDGTEFDNSYDRDSPITVTLGAGQVIPGFDEGLLGVQRGTRRQIDIPADLAYGATGKPPTIGPDEALIFIVDVVDVTGPTG